MNIGKLERANILAKILIPKIDGFFRYVFKFKY